MYYIAGFVVFIIIFILVSKFNKSVAGQYNELNKLSKQRWQEFASSAGLTYQEIAPPTDRKIHTSTGFVISGNFNNLPIEIYFYDETSIKEQLTETVYEIISDHRITIQSPVNSQWSVEPKSPNSAAPPTNVPEFDATLTYQGPVGLLSPELLKSMAGSGWFHSVKQGTTFTFIDDFSKHISNTKGARANLSAVHPIWLTSGTNVLIDIQHSLSFIEFLTILAQS